MRTYLQLSGRYLLGRKGRSLVTFLGMGEAFGTGLVGGLTGLVAGIAVERLMTFCGNFINGMSFAFTIDWASVGLALVVALVVAPLVGALPARWAARLDVVEALQYE